MLCNGNTISSCHLLFQENLLTLPHSALWTDIQPPSTKKPKHITCVENITDLFLKSKVICEPTNVTCKFTDLIHDSTDVSTDVKCESSDIHDSTDVSTESDAKCESTDAMICCESSDVHNSTDEGRTEQCSDSEGDTSYSDKDDMFWVKAAEELSQQTECPFSQDTAASKSDQLVKETRSVATHDTQTSSKNFCTAQQIHLKRLHAINLLSLKKAMKE